jgi:hypothetical protein
MGAPAPIPPSVIRGLRSPSRLAGAGQEYHAAAQPSPRQGARPALARRRTRGLSWVSVDLVLFQGLHGLVKALIEGLGLLSIAVSALPRALMLTLLVGALKTVLIEGLVLTYR